MKLSISPRWRFLKILRNISQQNLWFSLKKEAIILLIIRRCDPKKCNFSYDSFQLPSHYRPTHEQKIWNFYSYYSNCVPMATISSFRRSQFTRDYIKLFFPAEKWKFSPPFMHINCHISNIFYQLKWAHFTHFIRLLLLLLPFSLPRGAWALESCYHNFSSIYSLHPFMPCDSSIFC